jgi:hypothetical protein
LWCACSDSTFTKYTKEEAYFYFVIQISAPLTSVTSTQFSSTYTFNVGFGGTILFPTFTTVPSPTGYTKSKFGLIVDDTILSSSGTTASSLSWLAFDTT